MKSNVSLVQDGIRRQEGVYHFCAVAQGHATVLPKSLRYLSRLQVEPANLSLLNDALPSAKPGPAHALNHAFSSLLI